MTEKTVRKKIYLPKWQRWFLLPIFLGIWSLITYEEFFNPNSSDQLGMLGYLLLSTIFLGLAIMMWLMTSGKLAAYEAEEDIKDKS